MTTTLFSFYNIQTKENDICPPPLYLIFKKSKQGEGVTPLHSFHLYTLLFSPSKHSIIT